MGNDPAAVAEGARPYGPYGRATVATAALAAAEPPPPVSILSHLPGFTSIHPSGLGSTRPYTLTGIPECRPLTRTATACQPSRTELVTGGAGRA